VRPSEFVRSASLRLGLLHAALIAVASLTLFALTYSVTANVTIDQIDAGIDAQLSALLSEAATDGLSALASTIRRISLEPLKTEDFYLLQDSGGRRVAGNLPPRPPIEGWLDLPFPPNQRQDRQRQHPVRAKGVLLADDSYLLVGRDTHEFNELRETIVHRSPSALAQRSPSSS
jgi:hypothetical protein